MSVEGRVIVDALFYDRDGSVSLNVVSLNRATTVSGGKISVAEGVASTQPSLVDGSGYRNASGELVVFYEHDLFVVSATGGIAVTSVAAGDALNVVSVTNGCSVLQNPAGGGSDGLYVSTFSGTARYSIMFVGS